MLQRTTKEEERIPESLAHPRRRDIFFHAIKTAKLMGALVVDRRVPVVRKLLFVGTLIAFLVILLFPDAFGEVVMSTILPLAGTVLGVPLDASFDWVAFALAAVGMIRIFPPELVSEHYKHIFS